MRSENEIRERLEHIEGSLENSTGHDVGRLLRSLTVTSTSASQMVDDLSHLIGQRNILEWVLDEDSSSSGSSEHWTGQMGPRR